METASASSQSHTSSRNGSSQFPRTEEERGLGGDKLMFNVDADLAADDTIRQGPSAPKCKSRRPRFPPCQAKSEAYTREIDDSIEDTHLQHNLKRHPSAQVRKGLVHSFLPFHLSVRYIYSMYAN